MIKIKSKKARFVAYMGIFILFIGILFFLLRGPYLSNSIKRILIPVLENVTRERIIIDNAVINLFPFYVQAKGFKLFNKNGDRLLWITKTRAYIDILGLMSKEIRVRKLTLLEPDLKVSDKDLRRIIRHIKASEAIGEKGKYRVSLKNIELTDGSLIYSGAEGLSGISGSGLYLDMVSKQSSSTINVVLKKGTVKLPNKSELDGAFDGKIKVEDNRIEVAKLNISSYKSSFSVEGEMLLSDKGQVEDGSFSIKAKIEASTINKIFNLNNTKDGVLSAKGSVKLVQRKGSKWPGFDLDLKTDSRLHLETLMEILEVDDNITGELSFNGTIKGTYPDIEGKGRAKLENAVLDTLPIDRVEGEISYSNNKFTVHDFKAHTWNGNLAGDAHILIPTGDYHVAAAFTDIDSPQFFRFIEWEPPFPKGKVSGNVKLNHRGESNMEVIAEVGYRNASSREGDVLHRLQTAGTSIELRNNILKLKDAVLSTSRSNLFLDGIIDLDKETLDLDLKLDSMNAADLTTPYYTKLSAPIRFKGSATGLVGAPEIRGIIEAGSGSVHGIRFTEAYADLIYRIKSLAVNRMVINQGSAKCDISGRIDFPKAEELFSFVDPYYKAKAGFNNIDVEPFIRIFHKDIPVSGHVSGTVLFEGVSDNFVSSGDLVVKDSDIYGQRFDKVMVKYELHPQKIEFKSLRAYKGESDIRAEGALFFDKKFRASVSSKKLRTSDFPAFSHYPFDMALGIHIDGSGLIDNPDLKFSVNINESRLRGVHMGKGEITGTVKNKRLAARGSFINGLVTADANAVFSEKLVWNVNSRFNKGRYDFLLSGFTQEVPEELQVSLEGEVKAEGRGDSISMRSRFTSAVFSLYGNDFINREDIDLELQDNELRIKSFSLRGKNADLFAEGAVKLKEEYNLHLKGNMGIAPLKVINNKIISLRGDSDFDFNIKGSWQSPEVYGKISLSDATATLSGLPYTIGPVRGAFILDKDRITFESVNSRFAGGSVLLSGAGNLKGLSFKRFFMSADFNGIKIRPVDGLNAALDGKLFYEITPNDSAITGNIEIKRARYTKRIEWKSWLLGLKGINKERVGYPEYLADTMINVRVTGTDNIIIDNNIARAPVKVALNLSGKVSQIGALGRIEANEGTVYFRSNEFTILEGSSVDFVDPYGISPFFHILADTYINDYYVKLTLDGTIDEFTLSLFSDPPLPETDILALLTIGQTGKTAKGIESGIAAGEATSIITGGIQDTVEEQFKYYTGFERFEIEPHTSTEGAFVPKVTVGKRLYEDRLYVTYSTTIGSAEEDVIKLEYRIDKNLSIVGSRNEIGSAGVDFKYRFEFK